MLGVAVHDPLRSLVEPKSRTAATPNLILTNAVSCQGRGHLNAIRSTETARVHRAHWRLCDVADCCDGSAVEYSRHRLYQWIIGKCLCCLCASLSRRAWGN